MTVVGGSLPCLGRDCGAADPAVVEVDVAAGEASAHHYHGGGCRGEFLGCGGLAGRLEEDDAVRRYLPATAGRIRAVLVELDLKNEE